MLNRRKFPFSTMVASAVLVFVVYAAGQADFPPDFRFEESSLTGWHSLGQAQWNAETGEIVGIPDAGTSGGWLVLDKRYQDLQFYTEFRCAAPCKTGVLIRAARTPDGGMKGLFFSLDGSDLGSYILTLDAQGHEVSRDKLKVPTEADRSMSSVESMASSAARRGGFASAPTIGDWNQFQITLTGSYLRPALNGAVVSSGLLDEIPAYGAIALYAAGPAEVRFKNISWKDLNSVVEPKEQTSSRFTAQRIIDYYYGWSAAAADINHDGILDVVSGPFYFLGPDYTERRLYREGKIYNPSSEWAPDMVNFSYDFTGDGWADILSSNLGSTRPMDLYVNPKGELRRWDHYPAVKDIISEIVLMKDLDGDGKPEILYGGADGCAYAKPDLDHPTPVWSIHKISSGARSNMHGLGVGDINGDGRMDVTVPAGWYEQPPDGSRQEPWIFHKADFGRGGAEMGIYDVNGDGLNDVVTALQAHGFGLAWFEQKRDQAGVISFVQHTISLDYSANNAGGIAFSQPHALVFADFDGDGVKDFVVGKSPWHHLETYLDPDPYGPAVLYLYRTVRNPKEPGGAEFVPELIHNRSGVGSTLEVADLNKDGALDVITASIKGVFIFFGKPGS